MIDNNFYIIELKTKSNLNSDNGLDKDFSAGERDICRVMLICLQLVQRELNHSLMYILPTCLHNLSVYVFHLHVYIVRMRKLHSHNNYRLTYQIQSTRNYLYLLFFLNVKYEKNLYIKIIYD